MKKLLLYGLLLIANSALAQYNPEKDEKAQYEKRSKFYAAHKIKEVKLYLLKQESGTPNDSTLFCKMNYDGNGNMVQQIRYLPNAGAFNITHRIFKTNYEYGKTSQITKQTFGIESYALTAQGNLVKNQSDPLNQVTNYYYDGKDNLLKEIYKTNITIMNGYGHIGDTNDYNYDANSNLIRRTQYTAEGKLSSTNTYTYNKKNELIGEAYFEDTSKIAFTHSDFKYTHTQEGIIKTVYQFSGTNTLVGQWEYDYDNRDNLIKTYEIKGSIRKLLRAFKFNKQNQLIESRGGPVKDRDLVVEDVRSGLMAHLFYVYDTEGLLTEIKKYEVDKLTGKEVLTAVEKLVYKKY
jgi:hypothetical protein